MDEVPILMQGTLLLIDAAGPESTVGLLKGREWIACRHTTREFLEMLQPTVSEIMRDQDLEFVELSGICLGTGPGSTLGLRLAAMFAKTLMRLPELEGLACYQYQNLEAAICGTESLTAAVAPWRRDRLHLCTVDPVTGAFENSGISPCEAVEKNLTGFVLGRRLPADDPEIDWKPFPASRLPEILHEHPGLLRRTTNPSPYSAEIPEFRKWDSKRHSAG